MEKVVFTTGGTGGHIYPALAIAKEMRKKKYRYFIHRDKA